MTGVFYSTVRLLRALPERYRVMALHAAMFWSDDRLNAAELNGDLPGHLGELVEPKAAPVLKLVSNAPLVMEGT
jgi:hypothetical protein